MKITKMTLTNFKWRAEERSNGEESLIVMKTK